MNNFLLGYFLFSFKGSSSAIIVIDHDEEHDKQQQQQVSGGGGAGGSTLKQQQSSSSTATMALLFERSGSENGSLANLGPHAGTLCLSPGHYGTTTMTSSIQPPPPPSPSGNNDDNNNNGNGNGNGNNGNNGGRRHNSRYVCVVMNVLLYGNTLLLICSLNSASSFN
jgi:hypothetical protein